MTDRSGRFWTDDNIKELRELYAKGFTHGQISAKMPGATRNMIIGKALRLGLAKPKPGTRSQSSAPRLDRRLPKLIAPLRKNTPNITFAKMSIAPIERPKMDIVIPQSERVTIAELRGTMCRWPLGDPALESFRYCGAVKPPAGSYCAYHSRIAYQPVNERDRERRAQRRGA